MKIWKFYILKTFDLWYSEKWDEEEGKLNAMNHVDNEILLYLKKQTFFSQGGEGWVWGIRVDLS